MKRKGNNLGVRRQEIGDRSTAVARTAQPWDCFPGRTVLSQVAAPLNPGTQLRSANPLHHGQVMAGLDSPPSSRLAQRPVVVLPSPVSRLPSRVAPSRRAFVSSCLTSCRSGVTPVSRSVPLRSSASPGRAGTVNPSSTPVSRLPSPVSRSAPVSSRASARAGFTMIEVLFAIMILALGLVMVAASFPVAIKWTRQDTNKTIGRLIATNALGIIETEYAPTSFAGINTSTPMPLPTLPSLIDRTYAFGTPSPYPDGGTTANSLYFWTALICQAPSQATSTQPAVQPQPTYDLYILVFKKGNLTDTYTPATSAAPALLGGTGGRLSTDGSLVPYVAGGTVSGGTFTNGSTLANMPIGALGIDLDTGAVFRTIINNTSGTPTIWRSDIPLNGTLPADNVAYAPPADGQTASPLIYIYTTTFTP